MAKHTKVDSIEERLKISGVGSPIFVKGKAYWSIQVSSGNYPVHQAFRLSDLDPKPLYLVVADEE